MSVRTTPDTGAMRAIVFADACGSTRLYEDHGDETAEQVISQLMEGLRNIVAGHQGRVVKEIGDELMCVFDDLGPCIEAAMAIQRFCEHTAAQGAEHGGLDVRVGINYGEAIEKNGDYFGDTVNVAARLAALAKCKQILVSRGVAEGITERGVQASVRYLDMVPVKGKGAPMEVHEVVWKAGDLTTITPHRPERSVKKRVLTLIHDGRAYRLDTLSGSELKLGRDETMDIVIKHSLVSRHHATLSTVWGKFRLTDSSSNGTYATIEGRPVYLRREVAILTGSGSLCLGSPRGGEGICVDYRIE